MVGNIVDKMVRRHAHIFGEAKAETAEEVTALWVKIKEKEKAAAGKPRETSILDGVGSYLTALNRAEKLQKKVAKVGFDWADQQGVVAKIEEELAEVKAAMAEGDEAHVDEEIGDLLFVVANLARFRKRATSEELLRAANRKFETRFRHIERRLAEDGVPLGEAGSARLEALWREAKQIE